MTGPSDDTFAWAPVARNVPGNPAVDDGSFVGRLTEEATFDLEEYFALEEALALVEVEPEDRDAAAAQPPPRRRRLTTA